MGRIHFKVTGKAGMASAEEVRVFSIGDIHEIAVDSFLFRSGCLFVRRNI
jgi:hypothetical protein